MPQAPPRNLDFESRLIPRLKQAEHEAEVAVRRADLDMLGHANNVHYLEWILESPPAEKWQEHRAVEVDIQFRSEAHAGDRLLSRCAGDGDKWCLHSLVRETDGAEVVRARTRWAPR